MTQQFYTKVYCQKGLKTGTQTGASYTNSLQHYSQQAEGANNPSACPQTGKWINKMCYIRTVSYYMGHKKA